MTAARSFRASVPAALLVAGMLAVPGLSATVRAAQALEEPKHSAALDDAIVAAAKRHGVPERLVRRIIMRESKYNPRARNRAFWGLMQISYPTAKSMGFKGTREELLNPVVNLRYAVPYLANAFLIAGRNDEAAVRLYAAGYYFTARSKGLLNALRTADSPSLSGIIDPPPPTVLAANAVAQPPQSIGIFGALFSPGRQAPPPAAPTPASPDPQATTVASAPPTEAGQDAKKEAAKDATQTGADMVADASGALAPPKKWKHDGGVTVIARGEQAVEQLAERAENGPGSSKSAKAHHPRKITLVASLDVPPTSPAQAYAAPGAPDSRLASAPSQAAIADATAPAATSTAARITNESLEIPAQYEEADQPAKAKPAKKVAKHHPSSEKPTRQALVEKEPLASGRSEAH